MKHESMISSTDEQFPSSLQLNKWLSNGKQRYWKIPSNRLRLRPFLETLNLVAIGKMIFIAILELIT